MLIDDDDDDRKTKIGIEVANARHMWLRHHFQGQKIKGQLAGAGAYCGGLPHSMLLLLILLWRTLRHASGSWQLNESERF